MSAPWSFSEPATSLEDSVPNLPTPEGRALGRELARLCDIEEERLRDRFPKAHRRCDDCAFRLGTTPNGCAETLMDAIKCSVEAVPFYCHKPIRDRDVPRPLTADDKRVLCAGFALLIGSEGLAEIVDSGAAE